ncbi:CPBP family intramembrane glutamic endopeptidase [Actinomycetaceae bacterium L2_0104]
MGSVDQRAAAERQTLWVLVTVSVWMTAWIAWGFIADPARYVERSLGLGGHLVDVAGWIWLPALAITALYAAYTLWVVPDARRYVVRFDALGLVAIWTAVVSGILEEVLFRHRLMDWLADLDLSVFTQVLVSGVVFGAAHALWMLMARDWRVIVSVVASTTALGLALAVLYLAADRSTLPAIAAHTGVNLIIEPGLIVAACLMGARTHHEDKETVEEHDGTP